MEEDPRTLEQFLEDECVSNLDDEEPPKEMSEKELFEEARSEIKMSNRYEGPLFYKREHMGVLYWRQWVDA